MNKQRGATLIIVLVVVSFMTIIATQLIEHNGFAKRRTTLMMAREQAYQLALGGEELARNWITKGFGKDNDKVHLNQPWATTPIEYPVEGGVIKATIEDAQSCFNLNILNGQTRTNPNNATRVGSGGNSSGQQKPNPNPGNPSSPGRGPNDKDPGPAIFQDLLQSVLEEVEVEPSAIAAAVTDWIDEDFEPNGPDGAEDLEYTSYEMPYRAANNLMASKSELRIIKGVTADVYKQIKDYICVLPFADFFEINVNTLSSEDGPLLKAILGDITLSEASSLLSERPEEGYDDGSFWGGVANADKISPNRKKIIAFKSDFFLVRLDVTLNGATFRMGSLLQRSGSKDQPFKVITRYFGDY